MRPLFLSHSAYAWALAGASIIFIASLVPAYKRTIIARFWGRASWSDSGSFWVIQILVLGGIVAAYVLSVRARGLVIGWHRPLVFSAGIALMLIGSAVTWLAVRQLGRFFTVRVAVRADHQVIDSGLYRLIRHPAYAGQILAELGIALTMTNWGALAAIVLCSSVAYSYRVVVEERTLLAELGPPYAEYMTRTHRLIPYVF